jgi:lipopolysaccharide/colanic/teichoic acid biosynthesis glycosyltransferase
MKVLKDAPTPVEVSAPEGSVGTLILTEFPTFECAPASGRRIQYALKRVIDIVLAGMGLVVLSPMLLGIIVAVKLSSPGAVFFLQERVGMGGRRFKLYKFRTMTNGAAQRVDEVFHLNHANGPLFKARDDPRVTRVGKMLRRSFMDELPQLINVLRGDMSLVGPRPCLPSEAVHMGEHVSFRFAVPQGLTGPWQANGHHAMTFVEQMRVEREYVQSWSLAKDVRILLRTIPLVLRRAGL